MADAAADIESHGMARTLKDLLSGAAGGIAQVLLGRLRLFICPFSWFNVVFRLSHVCIESLSFGMLNS